MPKKKISVIVPCYNEQQSVLLNTVNSLETTFKSIANCDYEIIVVDDGSRKKYTDVKGKHVSVIRHPVNKGYGSALKTGIQSAKYDYIAIADADNTYPISEFPNLVKQMHNFDMVIGMRKWRDISLIRRFPKYVLNTFAGFLAGNKIPDLNSGMRIFKKELSLKFWNIYPKGFSFTSTITMGSLTTGHSVKFIPISYAKRAGKSHIHPIKDTIRFFSLVTRISLYFNPLRIFVPVALVFLLLGILRSIRDIVVASNIGNLSQILFLMSFQIIFFGLLAEIINKRNG